jgi:hypothetical protein
MVSLLDRGGEKLFPKFSPFFVKMDTANNHHCHSLFYTYTLANN